MVLGRALRLAPVHARREGEEFTVGGAEVLALEPLEPGRRRDDCVRHVELDTVEQQPAGERATVQFAKREHRQDGTTC